MAHPRVEGQREDSGLNSRAVPVSEVFQSRLVNLRCPNQHQPAARVFERSQNGGAMRAKIEKPGALREAGGCSQCGDYRRVAQAPSPARRALS